MASLSPRRPISNTWLGPTQACSHRYLTRCNPVSPRLARCPALHSSDKHPSNQFSSKLRMRRSCHYRHQRVRPHGTTWSLVKPSRSSRRNCAIVRHPSPLVTTIFPLAYQMIFKLLLPLRLPLQSRSTPLVLDSRARKIHRFRHRSPAALHSNAEALCHKA